MAQVSLKGVYVHLANDPADFVFLDAFGQHGSDIQTGVEVRSRGPRQQAVANERTSRTITVSTPSVDQETWEKLESWAGELVMYRDPRGRLEWAIFPSISVQDRHVGNGSLSFDLRVVTHSEVV